MEESNRDAFTVKEFSRRIGVMPATIRQWLNSGELRGTKIGKTWLIPASELERIRNPAPK